MRIGIDVRYLSHGLIGGVHTHVLYLVQALVAAGSQHTFFLYADTKRPFELADLPDYVTVRYLPYRNGFSSVVHDFTMRRTMAHDNLDVVHFPANYGFGPANACTVITLHDQVNVMPYLHNLRHHPKDARTIAMMAYLGFCTRRALRHADLIITVSDYSKREIVNHSGFDPDRIIPVMNGPRANIRRITDPAALAEVRQRHQLTKPFVLGDAIKNPAVTVNAWKRLPQEIRDNWQIVFFSRTPNPPPPVFDGVEAGYVRLLVRPSDDDLLALYSMADAFIFPSWYEGLGLPVLEAMTCGAPVIASDRGSIPEVAGGAALVTDVDDIDGFARFIGQVLTQPAEAERLRQLGFARAAQFSWDRTARRVLEIYQQAAARPAQASLVTT
jgi:glycosyltransferase involved in cell wall biosynthesis